MSMFKLRSKYQIALMMLMVFLHSKTSYTDTPPDWAAEYKKLCTYDSSWCGKLKNGDGTWVKPKKEIIATLKILKDPIKTQAQAFGVDPRAIAGAIMAENSMNVSISDAAQDLILKAGLAGTAKRLLGKSMSYGLGQLNEDVAYMGEVWAAKLEKRTPRSREEIRDALLIPEQTVYLIAALMRYNQDVYKLYGIDISKDPGLMTTVYNLGNPEGRAKAAKELKRDPRVNYFGFFVNKYMSDVESTVGAPVVEEPKKTAAKVSPPPTQKTGDAGSLTKAPTLPQVKKVLKPAFTESVSLVLAPPGCNTNVNYGATDIENKYSTYQNFAVSGIAQKGKTFEVISPGLDCESEPWSLVRTSNGVTGWIKETVLEQKSKKILLPDIQCNEIGSKSCRANVQKISEKQVIEDSTQPSLVFLKLISKQKEVTYKNHAQDCREETDQTPEVVPLAVWPYNPQPSGTPTGPTESISSGGISGGIGGGSAFNSLPPVFSNSPRSQMVSQSPPATEKDIKEVQIAFDKKIKEFLRISGVKNIESLKTPENPYSLITEKLSDTQSKLRACQIRSDQRCALDKSILLQRIQKLVTKKNPSYQDIQSNLNNLRLLSWSVVMVPLPAKKLSIKGSEAEKPAHREIILRALEECEKSMAALETKTAVTSSNYHSAGKEIWRFKDIATNLSDTDFPDYYPYFEKIIAACDMSLSLTGEKTSEPGLYKKHICAKCEVERPEYLNSDMNGTKLTFDIMKKYAEEDPGLIQVVFLTQAEQLFPYNQRSRAEDAIFSARMATQQPGNGFGYYAVPEASGYCANRTAEAIEELIKSTPCVRTVYVPDRWLVNRLNELGNKVVYRPFENEDRYAIDISERNCK